LLLTLFSLVIKRKLSRQEPKYPAKRKESAGAQTKTDDKISTGDPLVFTALVQVFVLDLLEDGHVEQRVLVVLGDLPTALKGRVVRQLS
jgi:hypothetical protein